MPSNNVYLEQIDESLTGERIVASDNVHLERIAAALTGGVPGGGGATETDWDDLLNKPTTLGGFGITDASSDAELAAHEADTTSVHGITNIAALVTTTTLANSTLPAAFTTLSASGQIFGANGTAGAPGISFTNLTNAGFIKAASAGNSFDAIAAATVIARFDNSTANAGFTLNKDSGIQWSSTTLTGSSSIDLILARDAANTLALRNGTAAQALRVYNTYTNGSNYEFGFTSWNSNVFRIGTEFAGTGLIRELRFYVGGDRWKVNTSGHFLAETDNTYDIGASGATRPRHVYLGGNLLTGTNANVITRFLQFQTAANAVSNYFDGGVAAGVVALLPNSGTTMRLQISGVTVASPALFQSGSVAGFRQADGTIATFSNLPAAAAGNAGAMCPISDSDTVVWGATITGGGANHVLAYSNGTAWTVLAK